MGVDVSAMEQAVATKMGWTPLDGQQRAKGWDMLAPGGAKMAIRFDFISDETGQHFLELEQRKDRHSDWVASGFGISRKTADFWVMVNSQSVYMVPTKALATVLKKNRGSLEEKHSRRSGTESELRLFSRGQILPLELLSSAAVAITDSPVNKSD